MKKVAFVGASKRSGAFTKVLKENFADRYEIVAVMDIDPGKCRGWLQRDGLDVPVFSDFDEMCDTVKPDLNIVTTVDAFHAEYIIRSLDRKIGCISEKPLCISAEQCKAIRAARQRNPEVFAATSHNARYSPLTLKVRELLNSGIIGNVIRMEYTEMLDFRHGPSYFHRWNSRRKFSNGLELHKSCHHFDKMNFLLNSTAVSVSADGQLLMYGKNGPRDFEPDAENCSKCSFGKQCQYYFEYNKDLYQSEIYTPDMCVYSSDIDIEDNFAAIITFANNVMCTYSLCARTSYEGEIINIQGETGRLEARSTYARIKESDDVHDEMVIPDQSLKLYRFGKRECEDIAIPEGKGSHGGADLGIFSELFSDPVSPTLPTLEDGIQAVLTGCAAVESIRTGKKCYIKDL